MRPKSILYQMQDAEHRWELSGISSPEDKHENNEIWHLERHQKYGATIGLGFAPLFLCDWKMKQWSAPPPFRQRMPREVQPTSRGLSFPHNLPQTRRLTAFSPAVLSVLWRKQKPPKKPKILRKSSSLFSAFQDLSPTLSLALKMQKIRVL